MKNELIIALLCSVVLGFLNAKWLSTKKGYPFQYYFILGSIGIFGLISIFLKFFKG